VLVPLSPRAVEYVYDVLLRRVAIVGAELVGEDLR
jgi:hypothetical protein